MVRVVLADGHPVVRAGIRLELAQHPGVAVVGEAAEGEGALRLAGEARPDSTATLLYVRGKGLYSSPPLAALAKPEMQTWLSGNAHRYPFVWGRRRRH